MALGALLLLAAAAEAQPSGEPPYAEPRYAGWTWAERSLLPPLGDDARRAPSDQWLGTDKAYHAGGSFALTLAAHLALTEAAGASEAEALPVAAGGALFLGVMKETADLYRPHRPLFSYRDLVADVLGVLAAAGVVALW